MLGIRLFGWARTLGGDIAVGTGRLCRKNPDASDDAPPRKILARSLPDFQIETREK